MLLKHSMYYVLARGFPGVISFLALAIYTRLLTPENYGVYALVISWIVLLNAVIFQWVKLGVLRFLPSYKNDKNQFLSTVMVSFLILMFITSILFGTLFFHIKETIDSKILVLAIFYLWHQAWYDLNLEIIRSNLSPVKYGIINFIKTVLSLLLGVYFISLGFEAAGIILGLIISILLTMIFTFKSTWKGVRFKFVRLNILKELLVYGLPLTINFALIFIINSSDKIMLGWLGNQSDVGLYSVGYDLAQQTLGLIMMIINLAAYPLVIKSLDKGQKKVSIQLTEYFTLLLSTALPVTLILIIFAQDISNLFFGEEFRTAAAKLIPIISIAALISGLKAYYFDLSFQLGKNTKKQVLVSLWPAILNLLLNLYFIPIFGYMAAAYTTLISFTLSIILSWRLGKTVFKIPIDLKVVYRILLALLFMGIGMLVVTIEGHIGMFIRILVGLVIYIFMIFIMNIYSLKKIVKKYRFKAKRL